MRFSDIADELGQTQGTAHAILKTLSDRGWVTRDPTTKSFELGPMLSLIAASLNTARPLAHVAREAARRLSRTLDMPVSVVEVAGDELLITAFESPADNSLQEAVTDRIPYLPPFGVAFAAWDTTEAQRDWIARGGAGDTDLERRLHAVLARTRDRGYDVDWMTPALAQIAHALGAISVDTLPAGLRPIIDQLDRTQHSRAWNDAKVSAHHGIIPTLEPANLSAMSEKELAVYRLIRAHYLAQFLPPHEFDRTTARFSCGDQT
ncbi:DNA topoisomerase, partial [Mycolicibacterium poriferae]|uniref:DNA topoisomerase n=1 Tax=Mycolicibacterium poriferae TaxID=39694 RepID=UPI003D2EB913